MAGRDDVTDAVTVEPACLLRSYIRHTSCGSIFQRNSTPYHNIKINQINVPPNLNNNCTLCFLGDGLCNPFQTQTRLGQETRNLIQCLTSTVSCLALGSIQLVKMELGHTAFFSIWIDVHLYNVY